MSKNLKLTLLTFLSLSVFFVDQYTKHLIIDLFHEGTVPFVVTGFFNIVMAWNRGVSFSFLRDAHEQIPYILAGFSFIVSLILLVWMVREKKFLVQAGISLIIAGGIGNAYDRLNYHAVVDFLEFHYNGWFFPAFNVADISINIGVGLILIDLIFFMPARTKPKVDE